eukprot:56357-Chlamydomonas_euryale.AAC.7
MQATGSSYACDFVHCFATLYGAAWLVHGGIALQQCRPLLTTARHFLVLRLGLVEPTWEEVNGDDPSPKVFDEFFAMDPDNEFGMAAGGGGWEEGYDFQRGSLGGMADLVACPGHHVLLSFIEWISSQQLECLDGKAWTLRAGQLVAQFCVPHAKVQPSQLQHQQPLVAPQMLHSWLVLGATWCNRDDGCQAAIAAARFRTLGQGGGKAGLDGQGLRSNIGGKQLWACCDLVIHEHASCTKHKTTS